MSVAGDPAAAVTARLNTAASTLTTGWYARVGNLFRGVNPIASSSRMSGCNAQSSYVARSGGMGFKDCYLIANDCYPKNENHSLRKRLHFSLRIYLRYRSTVNCIETFFAATALRRRLFALPGLREDLYIQQIRPCLYRNSMSSHRLHFLTSHFRMLQRTHRDSVIEKLYTGALSPIVINEKDHVLTFDMHYHRGVMKEGLMQFSMSMNGVGLCRITFWLMEYDGVPTLCIGALQGGKGVLTLNHAFTKEFWGLRPHYMALTALRWYAHAMGIEQIYTFAKKNLWCKRVCKQTDLNAFWQEQGATEVTGTPFIRLALSELRKSLDEVASRKRSAYRKRYKFLDDSRDILLKHFAQNFMRENVAPASSPDLAAHIPMPEHQQIRRHRRLSGLGKRVSAAAS